VENEHVEVEAEIPDRVTAAAQVENEHVEVVVGNQATAARG